MIKKKLLEHKVFLLLLLIVIIISYVWNLFLGKHLIILAGEYIFSFDYLGHVYNILNDPRSTLALDNTNCFDCIDFYEYSRWYSFFKIGYHGLSQILILHPFVFYILSIIIVQLTSLYIFVKLLFKRFTWFPFLIASFVFIFYSYKYSLLVATEDGLAYGGMVVYLTLLLWMIKNFNKLTFRKLILIGGLTGLILSSFFNINIAYFPLVIYASIVIAIIYIKNILVDKQKFFIFVLFLFLPTFIINMPLFYSVILYGDSLHYLGYISFNRTDSFLAGLSTAQAAKNVVDTFAILFLLSFFYAPIAFKKKIYLIILYLFLAAMIMGMNSPINIYGWLFIHAPLFDSLRATYRLMFFELVIFFIIIYLSLQKLQTKGVLRKIILFTISGLFILLPIYHIVTHSNYFFTATLPDEYFQAQKYLNTLPDKKMYFPMTTLILHNIATDYTWGNPDYKASILLYKNPYTSLLPIRNLVQFERFPYLLSPQYQELRYLTDMKLPIVEIIKAMELRGVRYVIVDENYKWKENYPNFDEDKLIKMIKIQKKFGNIYILKLPDQSSQCKKSYGTISLNYCTSYNNPTLLGKTKEEYLLEQYPEKINTKEFTLRTNGMYIRNVFDPILHQSFIDNKVLLNKEVMQVFGNQQDIFYSDPLKEGKYQVFIALYKYKKKGKLMGDAIVSVRTPLETVKNLSPYKDKPGMYWEKITVNLAQPGRVSIDMIGDGYAIFGFIPRIKPL